jgi:hypothetical protein
VRREGPGRCLGVASQSQVGEGFVKFLELSGVGRTMVHGTDKDGACATRVDGWVIWETSGRSTLAGKKLFSCCPYYSYLFSEGSRTTRLAFVFLYYSYPFCEGGSYPETCAQRTAESRISPMLDAYRPGVGS